VDVSDIGHVTRTLQVNNCTVNTGSTQATGQITSHIRYIRLVIIVFIRVIMKQHSLPVTQLAWVDSVSGITLSHQTPPACIYSQAHYK